MNEQNEHKFIRIATLENTIEAQLLGSILDEQNIPHHVRSYHDTAFDGLFQAQKGWGVISAPPSFKEDILGIILNIRSEGEDIQTKT